MKIQLQASPNSSFPQFRSDFCVCLQQIWTHSLLVDGQTGRWQFGQVPLLAGARFQLVLEGSSYNGGYTLDDFKIYDGLCASK